MLLLIFICFNLESKWSKEGLVRILWDGVKKFVKSIGRGVGLIKRGLF